MLLTKKQKENINKKYPLYSQDGKRKNAVCVAIKVNVKTPFGKMPQSVERDIYFTPKPLCDIKDKALQKFLLRLYNDEEENKAV